MNVTPQLSASLDDDLPPATGTHPRTAPPQPESGGTGMLGWAALIAVLLLLGMLFGASLWLYAAFAALGMLGVSRFLARAWSQNAVAHRHTGPLEVEVGKTVSIEVEIRNAGAIPIPWLLAEDLLPRSAMIYNPPALQVDGSRIRVMLLGPRRGRLLSYRLTCHRRGYFQIGPTVLETGDLMGLHRRYRVGAEPQYLLVMPKVVPLTGYDVASRRPIGEIKMRERIMDDPTRLKGIRQWQPGDPMRQVHWAATARTGVLHSKVYEQTSVAGVTLILDLHCDSNPQQHEPFRSELAITLAASIAAAVYEMNQPVGLASNGRDAADRIRTEGWSTDYRTRAAVQKNSAMRSRDDRLRPVVLPADRGPVHAHDIQRQLARLERSDGLTLESMLVETESRLARDTTLLVVLQSCSDTAAAALLGMSRRGWSVAAAVNTHEQEAFSRVAGPLIAAGISVMHLRDEASVPPICQNIILR